MPKKVTHDHFANYKYPGEMALSPGGQLAYTVAEASVADNKYTTTLYLKKEGGDVAVTAEDFKQFFWRGEKLIICGLLDKADKEQSDKGIPRSALHEYDPATGAMQKLLTVDRGVSKAVALPNDRWLLLCYDNLPHLKLWQEAGGDAEAYLKAKAVEDNYMVVEEWPFNTNEAGFRSRCRTRLYLWQAGALRLLTPEYMDLEHLAAHKGAWAVFAACEYTQLKPTTQKLYKLDLASLAITPLDEEEYIYIDLAAVDEDTLAAVRSDRAQYGEYQNEYIDKIRLSGGIERVNGDCEWHLYNSTSSDITYGTACMRWQYTPEAVWFIATVWDKPGIYRASFATGLIEPVTRLPEYNMLDFLRGPEGFYCIAAKGLSGPEIWALDENGGSPAPLTHLNDWMDKEYAYSTPRQVRFANQNDGVEVTGYVMKPVDFEEGKRYPAMLYIHGGPNTAYSDAFYHEAQLMAAQGYGVIFCNPRGSIGRGAAFADLRRKYCTVDYNDIMQFVDFTLADCEWIDPERLGVAGGSYGGMMVNWVITHQTRFKVAVSDRCTANEVSDFFCSDIGLSFALDVHGGDLWQPDMADKMNANSAIYYADKIVTPTLFVHGAEDYRCTKEQALQMYAALAYNGVPARVFIAKGETHGLCWSGGPAARVRRLQEITNWIQAYL